MIVESLFGSPERSPPAARVVLSPEDSRAVCQAIVASESRKAAVGVAECLVRIKELDSTAKVEQQRLAELGATERCRIAQTEQSKRSGQWAEVAQVSALESAETQRRAIAADQVVRREAVAAHARVELCRAQSGLLQSSTVSCLLLLALAVGVARAPSGARRPRAGLGSLLAKGALAAVALCLAASRLGLALPSCRPTPQQVFAWVPRLTRLLCTVTRLLQVNAMHGWAGPPQLDTARRGCAEAAETPAERARKTEPTDLGDAGTPATAAEVQSDGKAYGLHDKLAPWGLAAYAGALAARGYEAEDLAALNAEEAERLFELVGCKPGHRVRFRRLLESQTRLV